MAGTQPEGGILESNGQYVFESGANITVYCTLTDAGLKEGLIASDLRFKTSINNIIKPNPALDNATVSIVIANAPPAKDSRYNCGNTSNGNDFSLLHTVDFNIGCKMHFLFDRFICPSRK